MAAPNWVTLKVYDVLGRDVATIVDEYIGAGTYRVRFEGAALSSGTFFVRVKVGEFASVVKMLLAK